MNLAALGLGVGFVLVGMIAVGSRQKRVAPLPNGKNPRSSLRGTLGMFFIGLGLVVVITSL